MTNVSEVLPNEKTPSPGLIHVVGGSVVRAEAVQPPDDDNETRQIQRMVDGIVLGTVSAADVRQSPLARLVPMTRSDTGELTPYVRIVQADSDDLLSCIKTRRDGAWRAFTMLAQGRRSAETVVQSDREAVDHSHITHLIAELKQQNLLLPSQLLGQLRNAVMTVGLGADGRSAERHTTDLAHWDGSVAGVLSAAESAEAANQTIKGWINYLLPQAFLTDFAGIAYNETTTGNGRIVDVAGTYDPATRTATVNTGPDISFAESAEAVHTVVIPHEIGHHVHTYSISPLEAYAFMCLDSTEQSRSSYARSRSGNYETGLRESFSVDFQSFATTPRELLHRSPEKFQYFYNLFKAYDTSPPDKQLSDTTTWRVTADELLTESRWMANLAR